MADLKVLFMGPSGVGKSTTNNEITKLPIPWTEAEEKQTDHGLREGAGLNSCSNEVRVGDVGRSQLRFPLRSHCVLGQKVPET